MINHQKLLNEITQELSNDKNVLALILYGSIARHEENTNSDIDLMVIINEMYLQKRHEVRHGITVEFLEMHLNFLQNFITKNEIPIFFALSEGIILFNKVPEIEQLISEAKKILNNGPPVNKKWENERYKIKKRSDLTEIYKDLLDIDDEIAFNYTVSLLIKDVMPILNENYNLWPQSRKKTIDYLKSQCYDGYKYIETLLNSACSLPEKRDAAKNLIEFVLKAHGGILEGDATIFRVNTL